MSHTSQSIYNTRSNNIQNQELLKEAVKTLENKKPCVLSLQETNNDRNVTAKLFSHSIFSRPQLYNFFSRANWNKLVTQLTPSFFEKPLHRDEMDGYEITPNDFVGQAASPTNAGIALKNIVTVRYESVFNNILLSFLTKPFEVGVRHLKVAFAKNSQENFTELAKERVIYRKNYSAAEFECLTIFRRIYHGAVGLVETVGYLAVVVPFIVTALDKFYNIPFVVKPPPYSQTYRAHLEEGGDKIADEKEWRKNPFAVDGAQDPFYQGAAWIKA